MNLLTLAVMNQWLLTVLLLVSWGHSAHGKSNIFNAAAIDETVTEIRRQDNVAAVAVLLVDKDQILLDSHYGVRDWNTKEPFSNKDMYRIGSISKSLAGVLALRLQQQGLINLNDSIAAYGLSPYLKNTYKEQEITLAQLLEHTAGLKDLAKSEWDYNDAEPISLKAAFDLKLGNHHALWPPGMFRSYTNVGPGLFGLALELKLGESYESLMQKYVFDPLKMNNSSLLLTPEVKERLITGYDRDGEKPIKYWHNIYRPFAAINSNNQDTAKWLQMLLNQSDNFLSQKDRQRLIQPKTTLAANNGLSYGYGLGVYQWQTNGHSFYGHGGDADGYLTRFGFNPQSGLAYFVMINAFNHQPLYRIVEQIENQITSNLPKPVYPKRLTLDSLQSNRLVGTYQSVTSRFGGLLKHKKMKVYMAGKQLYFQTRGGYATSLHRVKGLQFRTSDESTATMGFFEHHERLYFQGPSGVFVQVSDSID